MRILVVGGTRFIGPYVVRELTHLGHEITVYHRGENNNMLPPTVRHFYSSQAAMPVRHFPDEVLEPAPDIVIHMIPMGDQDARAAIAAFRGRAKRMVWVSSGDVYRAYGIFTGIEPGPVEPGLLTGDNADLATVRQFRDHPGWRWTHGYVENVAHAIALAALHPKAAGRVYNVGERHTPTVAERLRFLPTSIGEAQAAFPANLDQDIVYDTARIRHELGYREPVGYGEGIRRSLTGSWPDRRKRI